ncbi:Cardiolipin synthetase [Bacillus mycoides]|nr:Cardiolipin synthetase [Bacillus mycoides]
MARLGGILLKKKERELLVKKGIHFTYYNKPDFPYLFSSLDHRNHRRISVIDGKIGYIGGFNIGKKYFLGGRKKLVIGEISIFKYEEKEFKI